MQITSYDISTINNGWTFPYNYHYIYIHENGKDAYIGETNNIMRRTREHLSSNDDCFRYDFKRIHVITGDNIEETPAKHYENLLLRLMYADGKFNIVNKDKYGTKTHYKRKNDFELEFDMLWSSLESLDLVKSKDIRSVINSNRYKYSPFNTLNKEQAHAISSIINVITSGETKPHKKGYFARPILIEGDAGSGKTVVATSLFHYLKTHEPFKNLKIGLVYANPATRSEIKRLFRSMPEISTQDIIKPVDITKSKYDIVICDEAHHLRRNKNLGNYATHFKSGNERLGFDNNHDELDWLLKNSDCLILFYDKNQIITPLDIPYTSIQERLYAEPRGIRPIKLQDQERILAGENYVPYVFDILNERDPTPIRFENYDFKLFSSMQDMMKELKSKEAELGLCRICGGYSWKWVSKTSPEIPDISIDGVDIWWNKQTSGWINNEGSKNDMGSSYTLPGIDLNYAAVLIGPELYYDKSENKIKVNKSRFYDNKLKRAVAPNDLQDYILNTYALFMTRGIYGTYIYVYDKPLRDYFSKYVL